MKVTKKWIKFIPLLTLIVGPVAETQAATSQLAILYTNAAKNRNGGDPQIKARLRNRIQVTNRTSRQSRANFFVRLVNIKRIGYNERGVDLFSSFIHLAGGGFTANEKIPRNEGRIVERRAKADLVSIITTGTGGGGNRGAVGWANTPGYYSAINADSLGNTQGVPHEIGHNFDGLHQRAHRLPNGLTTVMWGNFARAWTQYYSNPHVRRNGVLTGNGNKNNAIRMRRRDYANANRFR